MIVLRVGSTKRSTAARFRLDGISGLIRRDGSGFTFVELVMAMAVVAIVMAATTSVLAQLFSTNRSATNHMVAVRQVQSAGYLVSRDAVMAQIIEDTDDLVAPEDILRLEWTDFDNNLNQVTYELVNGQFKRTEGASQSVIASHIQTAQASFEDTSNPPDNIPDKIVFTVTANVGSATETRTYEVSPRTRLGN